MHACSPAHPIKVHRRILSFMPVCALQRAQTARQWLIESNGQARADRPETDRDCLADTVVWLDRLRLIGQRLIGTAWLIQSCCWTGQGGGDGVEHRRQGGEPPPGQLSDTLARPFLLSCFLAHALPSIFRHYEVKLHAWDLITGYAVHSPICKDRFRHTSQGRHRESCLSL